MGVSNSIALYITNLAYRLKHLFQASPMWLKRLVGIVARMSGLIVLAILLLLTYQQRQALIYALDIKPIYLIPLTVFYLIGFGLAVVNWHFLLRVFGEPHTLFDNYVQYAFLSAYRNIPIPYVALAFLAYSYKKRGTAYKTTGLVFVAFSVLYAVAGILIFSLTAMFGFSMGQSWVIYGAILASILAAFALHPTIFHQLIVAASGHTGKESIVIPPITWKPIIAFVCNSALILLLGGGVVFFCARAILDVPLSLLPVCVGGWSLAVCLGCLLFWSPSDFGLVNLTLLMVFQSSLPLAHFVAVFGIFRLISLLLDLINAGVAFLILSRTKNHDPAPEREPEDSLIPFPAHHPPVYPDNP